MKEFSSQTGGRYTFVDDILNLQELALAFSQIFNECDNFIISGCKVSGNSIGAGYIYLNGKLRYFTGASNISKWPHYIYESNRTETVAYASGTDKVGRNVYGCAAGESVPVSLDPLTNKVPAFLSINEKGGLTLKDAFFGKYALLLNPTNGKQAIQGDVTLTKNFEIKGNASFDKRIDLNNGASHFGMYYEGHKLIAIADTPSGVNYKFTIADQEGVQFFIDSDLIYTIANSTIEFATPISSKSAIFGGIRITPGEIFNNSTALDSATLKINMLGYNGGNEYYRTTMIGDGKNKAIMTVDGITHSVRINGKTTIINNDTAALVFRSTLPKSIVGLTQAIVWQDSNGSIIGSTGFVDSQTKQFTIDNRLASINITGIEYVNISPVIKEGGVALSEKYVQQQTYNTDMVQKADADNVYSIERADATFGNKKGGLAQFITTENTAQALCHQIGAVHANDTKKFVAIDQYLADMGNTPEAKKKIRNNIGAAGIEDFQTKLKDSGWQTIQTGLYIRQIGNIVSIQGRLVAKESGVLFKIPNMIDPPAHPVTVTNRLDNRDYIVVAIEGMHKDCMVKYSTGHGKSTEFSLTYMV